MLTVVRMAKVGCCCYYYEERYGRYVFDGCWIVVVAVAVVGVGVGVGVNGARVHCRQRYEIQEWLPCRFVVLVDLEKIYW